MTPEHHTPEAAAKLAARISSYWEARGFRVQTWTVDMGFNPYMRSAYVGVRSDMVAGCPVAKIGEARR